MGGDENPVRRINALRRRQRGRGFDTSLKTSSKPTRVPMRWPVIVKVRAGWGVRPWRLQCAVKRPRRRNSPENAETLSQSSGEQRCSMLPFGELQ
jgi:hypothetical protein